MDDFTNIVDACFDKRIIQLSNRYGEMKFTPQEFAEAINSLCPRLSLQAIINRIKERQEAAKQP